MVEKNLKLQSSYSTGCWAARNAVFQEEKKNQLRADSCQSPVILKKEHEMENKEEKL